MIRNIAFYTQLINEEVTDLSTTSEAVKLATDRNNKKNTATFFKCSLNCISVCATYSNVNMQKLLHLME